jgi:DNA modification methylase
LGRNFVGWEKDPEYHALAERRIQGAALVIDPLQPELF